MNMSRQISRRFCFCFLAFGVVVAAVPLAEAKEYQKNEQGRTIPTLTSTLGLGSHGPLLLQDLNFINHLTTFTQERIPERVVHAKAAGAFGTFEVTNPDIARYTGAKLFGRVGLQTSVVARLSTVVGEAGSADAFNDLRGFAVKFYTTAGNYDLLMLNTKTYNVRDPILFPSVTRSRKRNPSSHLLDNDNYWDFTSLRPETTFSTFLVFSDLGFPKNYRHMFGSAINTFKWTGGTNGKTYFVRYHMIPNQGKKIAQPEEYTAQAGADPDSFIRDLYESIEAGKFPSWTLNVQIMTVRQSKAAKFNPFDPTKIFPEKDYPLIPVGVMTLNKNPVNYFNEIERVAFQPGNLVPGIELSPDRVLHGRILAYSLTQSYRLGTAFNQIPVNCPRRNGLVAPVASDGVGNPNYFPSSYETEGIDPAAKQKIYFEDGDYVDRAETSEADNHSQVDEYWQTEMSVGERERTVKAIANHMSYATERTQNQALEKNWDPVNSELAGMMRAELKIANELRRKEKLEREVSD